MQTNKNTTDRAAPTGAGAGTDAGRGAEPTPARHTAATRATPAGHAATRAGHTAATRARLATATRARAPAPIDLTHGALGLPPAGGEQAWTAQHFLPLQRELGAWLRAGDFPTGATRLPCLFPKSIVSAGKTAVCDTDDAPLWFIGDLHGDFLALLHALHLAHAYDHSLPAHQAGLPPDAPTNLFFLGDFIDEGPHAAEIMAWLLASCAGRSFGGRRFSIMALLGNHDDGLAYDDSLRGFWSHVAPSDFFAQLNAAPDPALANAFGRAVCAFFHELPRMALLDKSILAVHGGVPNATLLSSIRNAADLESADALADYTWGRLLETRPEGITNQREKSGAWIGWREFDRFIEVFARITGAEPRLLLRGHDHKPRNFKWLEHYENCRVLTLNNFTVNGRDPKARKRYRPVTLARANHPRSAPLDVQVFQCDLPPALIEHCRNLPSLLENTTP